MSSLFIIIFLELPIKSYKIIPFINIGFLVHDIADLLFVDVIFKYG